MAADDHGDARDRLAAICRSAPPEERFREAGRRCRAYFLAHPERYEPQADGGFLDKEDPAAGWPFVRRMPELTYVDGEVVLERRRGDDP